MGGVCGMLGVVTRASPCPPKYGPARLAGGSSGISSRVTHVRTMDSTTRYPNGYVSYLSGKQTVNPNSGQTVGESDPYWHLPLG